MRTIAIDDPRDPRVADYRDIRERDLAGRRELFVAEGRVVVDVMLGAGRYRPESFLILASKLASMRPILERAPPDIPVYVAEPSVLDAVAGFPIHRGILAIGRRGTPPEPAVLLRALPDHAIVVGAVGIANHDNIGAIFRNAAAFGADAVLVDRGCCDPFYRKAIRVSVGNALRLPFARCGSTESMLTALLEAGFAVVSLSPAGRTEIDDLERRGRTALLLGTEGEGLPAEIMARTETVRIAMAKGFDSLNVATAAAIALHRLMKRSV